MTVTYTVGDTREVIATIPDGSVDLIASSPPFLALRSYVPADHVSKGDEIGSEANPAEFIDMLLGLTAEWGRVLAPHGSIAIELGDTYAGGGNGPDAMKPSGSGSHNLYGIKVKSSGEYWPRRKSLACIPDLYTIALAYGIHPLTGKASPAGKWLVRNKIVWHRPNPAVGALGDKVRPSTSYIVVATRSAKRWFDLTAVRTEAKPGSYGSDGREGKDRSGNGFRGVTQGPTNYPRTDSNPAGAPPLDAWFDHYDGTHDTWTLTTQPSRLAHYAMWPAKLAERLVLSMCPLQVCLYCKQPRRRIEGAAEYLRTDSDVVPARLAQSDGHRISSGVNQHHNGDGANTSVIRNAPTLGWTDCGHADSWMAGTVLDPFAGSGTTLAVADLHGRDAIGIDFDQRNKAIYPARYDEVKRALYGTPAPMPGQEAFDFEVPA